MRIIAAAVMAAFLLPAAVGQQKYIDRDSAVVAVSGTTVKFSNEYGATIGSFTEQIVGSPGSMSIVLQGCIADLTGAALSPEVCDTIETNTSTSSSIRQLKATTIYDYFKVTPTFSGGTNPAVFIKKNLAPLAKNSSGSGTPGGADTNLQYNNGGAFAGFPDGTAHQVLHGGRTFGSVVAADTDTSVAHTGVDINTSFQVTALHLSGPTLCGAGNYARGIDASGNATGCTATTSGFSNPMTTLGDFIYENATPVPARLAGPTTYSGVPQSLTETASAGVAGSPSWAPGGVAVNTQSGASYTALLTDRLKLLNTSNNTTSTAVAIPQAGSANFDLNFAFVHCNTGSVVATDTPSTSTVNGNATLKLVGQVSTHNPECAFVWGDNTNYFAAEILPTDANGRLAAEGMPALTGDCTTSAGALSLTCSKINGTAFAGTNGNLVSYGASNTPSDTGIAAAQVVKASSPGAGIAHFPGSSQTVTSSPVVAADMSGQYSKSSCTELWGGSGASFALTSGDDAISNNTCYNDSGVTRTITAVKCRSDNASNTTTVNPTFGTSGTGTTILSGALTCGSSLAYSSTGTVSNASWTTGTGITPAMAGTLTGTSIAMIVEYTF